MTVLVGYATAHGSTKGIAERIAARLAEGEVEAVVLPVDRAGSVEGFEAVVVGSAIHSGVWLPDAAAFVRRNQAALAQRPVWLFSVSSVGDEGSFFPAAVARGMRKMRKESAELAGFRAATRARDHRHFAGVVERGDYPLTGHLFMKVFGGRYGDHRNWPDIDAWADRIAHQLTASVQGAQ